MARTKKTVNGGYQILDFNNANITTDGIVVEGAYKTILDAIKSNKALMVKNVILIDAGVDIEDNYANIVKVGTTFILSIGIVGDKTYTLSITDADTTSYQINDNASQSELNVVEDMVNQLSYNEAVPFNSTQTYAEGQYVIHEGQFYKCIIAVEEAGEFHINNWETVTIGNELEELVTTTNAINQNLTRLVCQNIYLSNSDATLNSNYAMSAEYILRQIESKQNNGYFSGTLDVNGNWYGFFGYNTSNNFSDDYAFIQLFKYGTSGNMCYRYSNYGGTIYKLD